MLAIGRVTARWATIPLPLVAHRCAVQRGFSVEEIAGSSEGGRSDVGRRRREAGRRASTSALSREARANQAGANESSMSSPNLGGPRCDARRRAYTPTRSSSARTWIRNSGRGGQGENGIVPASRPHIDPWRGKVGYGHATDFYARASPDRSTRSSYSVPRTRRCASPSRFVARLRYSARAIDRRRRHRLDCVTLPFDAFADVSITSASSLEFQAVFVKHLVRRRKVASCRSCAASARSADGSLSGGRPALARVSALGCDVGRRTPIERSSLPVRTLRKWSTLRRQGALDESAARRSRAYDRLRSSCECGGAPVYSRRGSSGPRAAASARSRSLLTRAPPTRKLRASAVGTLEIVARAFVVGRLSPKRGPTCARSAPAMTTVRSAFRSTTSRTKRRNSSLRGSSSGQRPSADSRRRRQDRQDADLASSY